MQRYNRLIILIFLSIIGIHCEAAQKQSRQMVVPFNLKTNPWWHPHATPMKALQRSTGGRREQWQDLKRAQAITEQFIPTLEVPKKIVGKQECDKGKNHSPAEIIVSYLVRQQMALVDREELEKYWVGRTRPKSLCFGDNKAGDAQRAFLKMQVRSNYNNGRYSDEQLLEKLLMGASSINLKKEGIVTGGADIAKQDLSFRELHELSDGRTWMPDYPYVKDEEEDKPNVKGEEEHKPILENIIQLKILSSRFPEMIVGPNDRMSDLRKRIAEVSGVPVEQLTLRLASTHYTNREIKRLLDCALYLTDLKDREMIVGDARYQY